MISPSGVWSSSTGFEAISDDKQLDALKDYLRAPSETTALVFVSDALDNRRNIATMLRKASRGRQLDPLDEREAAPQWIRGLRRASGRFIEPQAAAYLVGMVGVSLTRLSAELDKLINYAGEKGRIGEAGDRRTGSQFARAFGISRVDRRDPRRRPSPRAEPSRPHLRERIRKARDSALDDPRRDRHNYARCWRRRNMSGPTPERRSGEGRRNAPFHCQKLRFNEACVRKISLGGYCAGSHGSPRPTSCSKRRLATPRLQIKC